MAREGRYEEAAQRLAQAVELFPGQSALRNNLGYALMLDGKPQRACEELKVSLRLDPKNATARDNLAEVLRRLGEPQPGGLQDIEDIACEKAAPSAEATPRVSCQPAEGCMSTRDAGESARSQGSSPTIPTSSIPTSSDPHSSEPDSSGARTERSAAFALSPQTPGARLIQLAPQIYRLESSAQPVRADAPLHAVATTAATTATTAAPAPDGKPARPCPDDCARLAPSPVNARLLITNGNGRTGLAARWRRSLQTHLARLIRLGNRKGYAQRHTELLHRSGYRDAAEQLALQIGRDIKVREMPAAQLPAGVDLQLLLGHDGTSSPATAAWQPTAPTSQPAAGLPAPVALQTGAAEGLR
jgi:tetratricopeptide (TPR) repeat protein